jgi:hypothetical protein
MICSLMNGDLFPTMGGVVTSKRVKLLAKGVGLDIIERGSNQLGLFDRDNQVVAFFEQRDKTEPGATISP